MRICLKFSLILLCTQQAVLGFNYSSINLPEDHLKIYYNRHKTFASQCLQDATCPYKNLISANNDVKEQCWGYEYDCNWSKQRTKPHCPGDHRGWVKTKKNQEETFFTQADFGYVKQQMDETQVICEAMFPDDSSLECSKHLRFCRGRNLMLNFTDLLTRDEPLRYKMDVLKKGQIGGYCKLYEDRLHESTDHLSPLQSWGPEMRFFSELKQRPIIESKCDVVIDRPTYIMKIDAINMYHHFCDFVNLYASQHLNSTHPEAFTQDINILIWESYTYNSAFKEVFNVFTQNPILDLKTFRGEVVCFKNVMFPLLPRMIFGLYYNTPIIYGCEGSGLFKAFSEHLLHRLEITKQPKENDKVVVTLLSRGTKYRNIINEKELIAALGAYEDVDLQVVEFNAQLPFRRQVEIIANSDVLIGIHGAGLTHLLFLPDWAAVFELYNCEDPNCYADLARLRGLKYITWEKADLVQRHAGDNDPENAHAAHAKFANYSFDVDEFVRLTREATRHVMEHPEFNNEISILRQNSRTNAGIAEPLDYDESIEIDSDFDRFIEQREQQAKEALKDEL